MSKVKQDNLFELIKSLSRSEKRYFKVFSSRHTIGEENNYILFFDYLDKQDEYDEDDLYKHFNGEAFLNNLSIAKKRLYDHILNALDTFHSGNSLDAQLFKMIHCSDILFDKSLYQQSARLIRSAEKLAIKNERHSILIELSNRKKQLLETAGNSLPGINSITHIVESDEENLGALKQYTELWGKKSKLFELLSNKGISRDQEQQAAFQNLKEDLLNHYNPEKLSVASRYLYFHTVAAAFFGENNLVQSLDFVQKNLAMMEEAEDFIQKFPNYYFSALTNAIYLMERCGQQRDAALTLQKLKSFPQKYKLDLSGDLQIKLFSSTSSIELSMLINRGEFDELVKLIPVIENGLTLYGSKISPQRRSFLSFKIAGVFLANGDCSGALKWVNQILNDKQLDTSEDIVAFTHILDLLIHLELKHANLLPYSIKSTQRFLKSRNRLHSFEKVFLHFIGKLAKANDVFEDEERWGELYDELSKIKEDSFQSVALEYFDFQSWAKSKMERVAFKEIVKAKHNTVLV